MKITFNQKKAFFALMFLIYSFIFARYQPEIDPWINSTLICITWFFMAVYWSEPE